MTHGHLEKTTQAIPQVTPQAMLTSPDKSAATLISVHANVVILMQMLPSARFPEFATLLPFGCKRAAYVRSVGHD